jgi:hypothetical protein
VERRALDFTLLIVSSPDGYDNEKPIILVPDRFKKGDYIEEGKRSLSNYIPLLM